LYNLLLFQTALILYFIVHSDNIPSFADVTFDGEDNLHPFANSLTLTYDDFSNAQHKDNDYIAVAYGMWWASTRAKPGEASKVKQEFTFSKIAQHKDVQGGAFLWAEYGAAVDFEW
jgi:hypothetical protein